jgi:hypothetical protein
MGFGGTVDLMKIQFRIERTEDKFTELQIESTTENRTVIIGIKFHNSHSQSSHFTRH